MAFQDQNMRVMTRNGRATFWSYKNLDDTISNIKAVAYFKPYSPYLTIGDWIFVTGLDGGTILHVDETNPIEINTVR